MFKEIKTKVQTQFQKILETGPLFEVPVDKDKIWEIYIDSFDEEFKQGNRCNCCKSFLRQFAGIVGIKDNKLITLWDFEVSDPEYKNAVKALHSYISNIPIDTIFLSTVSKLGTDKSPDTKNSVVWEHFYLELPKTFVKNEVGPSQGSARDDKNVLKRSFDEISEDAIDTVFDLINQGTLYRGNEHKATIESFRKLREKYKKIKNNREKDLFCWVESKKVGGAICRIRNTSIGTLLNNLSEGMELDSAVTAFERVVAPANYKRPKALVTPKMIEAAQKRIEELGFMDSLNRRLLSDTDLSIANALYVDRPKLASNNIFDELKKDITINPKSLSKVDEVHIDDFIKNILPTAKTIRVLPENNHLGNFVSLVGPQNSDSPSMFKWGNSYSWSYTGGVADSIKERVKAAGGNVSGKLRISLAWDNEDDLDLHLHEPNGNHLYYPSKRRITSTGATLDVDANGGDGLMTNPVENIYWTDDPKVGGTYEIVVHQFQQRSSKNKGFTVEIDYDGETHHFSCDSNGLTGHNHKIAKFSFTKKDGFKIISGETKSAKYNSKEKWGIKTGQFYKLRSLLNSPNHWNSQVGNKHYFFILEKCVSDEPARPFYNEFLTPELDKERKTLEILGSKLKVETVENELSGLGFSDTIRNSLIVEVTSSFKRNIKIKF